MIPERSSGRCTRRAKWASRDLARPVYDEGSAGAGLAQKGAISDDVNDAEVMGAMMVEEMMTVD